MSQHFRCPCLTTVAPQAKYQSSYIYGSSGVTWPRHTCGHVHWAHQELVTELSLATRVPDCMGPTCMPQGKGCPSPKGGMQGTWHPSWCTLGG